MSVRALSISLLPLSLCSAFSGYFAAVRRVYKNAISQILEQMIKIFACAFLLSLFVPRGVEYACLALVLGGRSVKPLPLLCSFLLIFGINAS